MKKTIKEIADELDVSYQAVSKKISSIDNFKSKYVTRDNKNRMVINEQGFKVLSSYYKELPDEPMQKNAEDVNTDTPRETISPYSILDSQLKAKDKQLKEKDQQLKAKDKQINKLSDLLDHSQQLQLQTTKDNQSLKEQLNLFLENNSDDTKENKDEIKEKEQPKKSFFNKIFHRK